MSKFGHFIQSYGIFAGHDAFHKASSIALKPALSCCRAIDLIWKIADCRLWNIIIGSYETVNY